MENVSEEKKLTLDLAVYNEPEEAVLPKYCRRLNVYRFCEDDWPVVYVFTEDMKAAA
jgi:hypothetical protein